jgi:hypothetical protein
MINLPGKQQNQPPNGCKTACGSKAFGLAADLLLELLQNTLKDPTRDEIAKILEKLKELSRKKELT